jgi:F-type H+-transporting ATPase subunit a
MAGKKIDPFEHVVDHGLEIGGLQLKFIVLMTICAVGVGWAMIWLGRKMKNGDPPTGKLWNLIESLLFFVRDKIARPGIGEHDADKYLPYLTTLFLFIFSMNLIGLIPFLGSPTAAIWVTAALAFVSFVVIHATGFYDHGFGGYIKTFIPHVELEGGVLFKVLGSVIKCGMAVLEYATAFIRAGVLAVRLFANMLAGHTVLFMILFFIALVDNPDYKLPTYHPFGGLLR